MTKYQVGDWVRLIGSDNGEKAHIIEILEQTCGAGIKQVSYLIRLVRFNSYVSSRFGTFKIMEMEIERKLTDEEIKK